MVLRRKIALLVAQPEENYHAAFIKGFLTEAFADDYDVCIFAMYQRHQATKVRSRSESNIYSLIEFEMFDAVVILASSVQTPGVLEELEKELHLKYDKPVIFVDEESEYFFNIETDNYLPIKQMINHLIEVHGYKDIAFLTGNEFHPHARKRLQGFLDCMEEHGLTVGENRIFYGDFWYNSGRATAEQLLRNPEHLPEAVACANDYMAMGLIGELNKTGIRVPEDIAVTGYDDTLDGRHYSVPLTSVPIPTEACGKYSMQCVRAFLAGEEVKEFSAYTEPVIGRSCGCVPNPDERHQAIPSAYKFDFNEGTLEDDILGQTEIAGVLSTILYHIDLIKPFEGFHICLSEDWAEENLLMEGHGSGGYSDTMIDAVQCGGTGKTVECVDLTAEFPKKMLLPELSEASEKPRAYFFTPMYFEDRCFGYAAINYGEVIRCYDANYKRWLNSVMHGLECFVRIKTLTRKNDELEAAQTRDSLTGLYNYKGLLRLTADALNSVENAYVKLTVLELCGLNDLYMKEGIQSGDKLINDFSQMIFIALEKELTAYLGNGEIVVAEVSAEELDEVINPRYVDFQERFQEYCRQNQLEGKLEVFYSVICGQAENEEELGNLIGEAVGKKNAVKIKARRRKEASLTEDEMKRVELVADILDNNRLIYHFQPIVDAETGDIYAYEALMRADTPEKISPLDILKYAEHLGRLVDVEMATFSNVLNYIEEHEEEFDNKKIFINSIPGTQLSIENAELLRKKITRMNGKIVVELTEQAEVDDSELEILKSRFEKLGVDTAVDDYGTGYSNVYNLLRYMPNYVKIDRMLLTNIQASAQKQHFVKEIIKFSHDNQISVLAEGVETAEELKTVVSLGADLIQGYYTARPNPEVLPGIDHKVKGEIVQFSQYALERGNKKAFQAGHDGDISLIKLVSSHYSKIRFSPDVIRHQYVTINGLQGFRANVEIEVADGYSGRMELKDVNLIANGDHPTIKLGYDCDVTLVLSGECILEKGGILVPEGSKLTIQGDGNLTIDHLSANGYGIGNDKDSRHGEISFEQDGNITIKGNLMHGVGIGSGLGGILNIDRGSYSIQLTGEEAVGIGALHNDVDLTISHCSMEFEIKNAKNVGIGSVSGNVNVEISYASLSGIFSAGRSICIGTLDGKECNCRLKEGTIDFEIRSENSCGIGNLNGKTTINLHNFAVKILAEGKDSIAMGNLDKTAEIHTKNVDVSTKVRNKLDFDIGAAVFEMVSGRGRFHLNGEEIQRDILEGEL